MTIAISNSEVSTFLQCERRHFYSFIDNGGLEAKTKSMSLNRGIIGHEILAVYFKALQRGSNEKDAQVEAMKRLS